MTGRDDTGGRRPTFSIIAEAHLGLAEANCVFSLAHAIELLQLTLVYTLTGKVDFDGLDADVLRSGRHDGGGGEAVDEIAGERFSDEN